MNNNQMVVQEANPMMIIEGLKLDRVADSINTINQFQQVIQSNLVEGIDYGEAYFGSGKSSLLKPGAEKILMLMGLSSQYEIIEQIQDYEEGFFAYTIRCILTRNGIVVTEGLGHCNSKEKKYESDKQDKYMLGNTCLKMAKKRAQVDAALTVGSLSNIFTQDLEDMVQFNNTERVETMTLEDARAIKVRFGKYGDNGGKTIGEIYATDEGYVKWLSEKAKEPAMRKAAAMVMEGGSPISGKPKAPINNSNNNATTNVDINPDDIADLPWNELDDENIPY